jgi:DNA-binding NtrC family response regulator
LQAEYPAVKVIFMSGYPKREPVVEMLAHADIGWVQKPPGLMSLAEALHRALH